MRRRSPDQPSLRDFSDDELFEEITRRRNAIQKASEPENYCDDCRNFVAYENPAFPDNINPVVPGDYNPCEKGHKMSFRYPEDYGDNWGFYRRACPDRQMRDKP